MLIATFNDARYLPQAVSSALAQTWRDFEVVVVDDGSTDNTREVLEPFRGRIRYLHQANQGLTASRNKGIEVARGEILAFLDSDDFWDPTLLKKQVAVLDSRPEVGLVHSWVKLVDVDGKPFGTEGRAPIALDDRVKAFQRLLMGNWMCGNVSIRRRCFERVGGFDVEVFHPEDWDMYLRIARCYHLAEVPEVLAFVRRYGDSKASRALSRNVESALPRILGKFFSGDAPVEIPDQVRRSAFSNAYWALAWANYASGNPARGGHWLEKAARIDPLEFKVPSDCLVTRIAYAADGLHEPSTSLEQSREAIERFFDHLPASLRDLSGLRTETLGLAFGISLFRNRKRGCWKEVRQAAPRALWHRPAWVANRGFLSIWLRSLLPGLR